MEDRVILMSYDKQVNYILGAHKHITAGRDTFDIDDVKFLDTLTHAYFLAPYDMITSDIVESVNRA